MKYESEKKLWMRSKFALNSKKKKKKLVNIKLANIPLKYELCLIVGDQPVEATK